MTNLIEPYRQLGEPQDGKATGDGPIFKAGIRFSGLLAACMASPAFAHHAMDGQTPTTIIQGLFSGLAHPLIGPDHLAFMGIAAMLACGLTGFSRLAALALFIIGSSLGAAAQIAGWSLPMAEALLAVSLMVGGLVLLGRWTGAAQIMLLLGVAGLVHGYAFAESIVGADRSVVHAYLLGLGTIQFVSLLGGITLLTHLDRRFGQRRFAVALRGFGLTGMLGGLSMLVPSMT